jgi:ElaB/YqjD/DUF883 family membrane-anchored ribosome-binding protein
MVDMKDKAKNAADTAEDKAKGIAGKVADVAQSAKQAGEGLLNRAGDMASTARDKVEDWAGDARDAVQHAGEKAQRWAGDAYDATADSVSDFGNEVTAMVRKHPLPALLIGFGVGLLLGRTMRMI